MLETRLVERLVSWPDLSTYVAQPGKPFALYPMMVPNAANVVKGSPVITYQLVDIVRVYTHSGEANKKTSRVQVTLWAKTYGEAKTIGQAMTEALTTWRASYDDLTVDFTEIADERDEYDETSKLFGLSVDIMTTYTVHN